MKTLNRRAVLSTVAAGATALAAVPAIAIAADPIFAAIDAHRIASAAYEAAVRDYYEASSQALAGDDAAYDEAYKIEQRTARALIDVKPTTMAGALALIDHLAAIGPIDG